VKIKTLLLFVLLFLSKSLIILFLGNYTVYNDLEDFGVVVLLVFNYV
jgi:hypothetical protein